MSKTTAAPTSLEDFLTRRLADDQALIADRVWTRQFADRMSAECESKRRIMALDGVSEDVLRLLALPYSAHPEFRPEWRPAS